MITNIDYNRLVRLLLPVRLRVDSVLAWCKALISPIANTLYPRFKNFEYRAWHDLKYQSGQVAHLEFVLNERFDPAQKRIWIGPGSNVDARVYLFLATENHPQYIFKIPPENEVIYLHTDAELASGSAGSYDFTINVPTGLPNEETTLKAVADRYKRDSKTYIINYF